MRFAPKKGKFVFSLGVLCALAMPMTNVFGEGGGIYCGDGICNFGENCASCPKDCGPCEVCGNEICEEGEDCETCEEDCPCKEGETCVDGECVNIIPTVSEWGLIVMVLLALTAGTIVFARRRRPAVA